MADAKKYLDLEGLTLYNSKITGYVNEKESALDAKITAEKNRAEGVEGTLANLTTEAKDNLVAAINEVDANADTAAVAAKAAQDDVDALETFVGVLPEGAMATTVTGYIDEAAGAVAADLTALDESLKAVAKSG